MSPEEARLRCAMERDGCKICRCVEFGGSGFPDIPDDRRWIGYRAFHALASCALCDGDGVRFPRIENTPDPEIPF